MSSGRYQRQPCLLSTIRFVSQIAETETETKLPGICWCQNLREIKGFRPLFHNGDLAPHFYPQNRQKRCRDDRHATFKQILTLEECPYTPEKWSIEMPANF